MKNLKKLFLFSIFTCLSSSLFSMEFIKPDREEIERSPSASHLESPAYSKSSNNILFKCWISKYDGIFQSVVAKEKELHDTHHVFYHGQNIFFYVLQDLITRFQKYYKNLKLDDSAFSFLRSPGEVFEFNNIDDFLFSHSPIDDTNSRLGEQLMSVNLSFAGSSSDLSCSAFSYFMQNDSFNSRPTDILNEVFDFFEKEFHLTIEAKIRDSYKNKLLELLVGFQQGCLVQIFIPKDKVNQCVYMSQRLGVPLRDQNIVPGLFDKEKNRYADTSRFINNYFKRLDLMHNDNIQARILFTNDIMLNPDSGVKIYKYLDLEPEKLNRFKQELEDLFVGLAVDIACNKCDMDLDDDFDDDESDCEMFLDQV